MEEKTIYIYTSNFARNSRKENAVAISRGTPKWFFKSKFTHLAPSYGLLKSFNNMTPRDWEMTYFKELNRLNKTPDQIAEECEGKILLCWEKETDICHRFSLARWLEYFSSYNVVVEEIDKDGYIIPREKCKNRLKGWWEKPKEVEQQSFL